MSEDNGIRKLSKLTIEPYIIHRYQCTNNVLYCLQNNRMEIKGTGETTRLI